MNQITFRGKPIKIRGKLPQIGDQVPDFTFIKTDLSRSSFYSYQGKTRVIISFPSIDTSVCAKETRAFNQAFDKKPDVVGFTISQDLPFALQRFCGAEGIDNLQPVSVFNETFGEKYGLLIDDGPLQGLLARAVFLVTPDNTLEYLELVTEITYEPNYKALLAAL